jgi:hypothetical protein
VCPEEPQNGLTNLTEGLNTPPPHLYPQIPPTPCWKAPKQPQDVVIKPLDTQFPFLYIQLTLKRVLIKFLIGCCQSIKPRVL